jgi:hypothetical protein
LDSCRITERTNKEGWSFHEFDVSTLNRRRWSFDGWNCKTWALSLCFPRSRSSSQESDPRIDYFLEYVRPMEEGGRRKAQEDVNLNIAL